MSGMPLWSCVCLAAMVRIQASLPQTGEKPDGETLYNGIRLPAAWPPRVPLSREPMALPYLKSPPEVIPIDVGRQLFVDDFLVQETSLRRVFHRPEAYSGNPVLSPDQPWEKQGKSPVAMVFSDGVWWDPSAGRFRMWYMGGLFNATCMAESSDGLAWRKPALDIEPGTGVVVRAGRDSSTVWLDPGEKEPGRRYKMLMVSGFQYVLRESADGIHWSVPAAVSTKCNDRSTVFYNPFRKVWVLSIRSWGMPRSRKYREHADLRKALEWSGPDLVPWVGADRLDPHHPDPEHRAIEPQLYNLDAVAYESLLLGMFEIHRGPENDKCMTAGLPKTTELSFAYSRDGFHWHRPDRRAHIPAERRDVWDRGYVQSIGNICTVRGDKLWIYYTGFQGDSKKLSHNWLQNGMYDRGATGVALLRRDGFASLDAGDALATLTTRPVTFSGRRVFVNAATTAGELRVAILDEAGQPIAPFTTENCRSIRADNTLEPVTWSGAEDVSALRGKPVRFRFTVRNGSLYAFWVSRDDTGRSDGYVAGGGPGFSEMIDTAGRAALDAERRLGVSKTHPY